MSTIRAAMTQTCNAYTPMPASVDDLGTLAPRLDEIRRANVGQHLQLIERARERGAVVIGLGELFPAPYFALRRDAFWREMAEDAVSGPSVTALRDIALRLGTVIVAPIYEKAKDGLFNTAVVIDADGTVLGRQRKCHIPQGSNEQGSFDERFYYGPSNGEAFPGARTCSDNRFFPVFETAVGRVGVAICYDRHFAGAMSALVRGGSGGSGGSGGAQLIFSPAVTFGAKSRRLWSLEFPVDAARHNVFIGGSNRLGSEPPWHQPYFGESYFVGPNGVLADQSDDEGLVISDVDLDELVRPDPAGWNLARDARPEAY
jgi:N-carbamoylputrescine amidase